VAQDSEKHIAELQSQLAFQEDELEKMHDALYQQQLRMDAIDLQLKRISEQYKTLAENQSDSAAPTEEKPPHY